MKSLNEGSLPKELKALKRESESSLLCMRAHENGAGMFGP